MYTRFTALLVLLAVNVEAGLLRVPKIYNTVITSDANLEPSRAYPIVQPVLTVGVQPVVAAAVASDHRGHPAAAYYPLAVGGLYPFLSGTNALYSAPVLYHQPAYGPQQTVYGPGPEQRPVPPLQPALAPAPAPAPTSALVPAPAFAPASAQAPLRPPQAQQPAQLPSMPAPDRLNHGMKNPEIPDVPPPPLPVSAKKS